MVRGRVSPRPARRLVEPCGGEPVSPRCPSDVRACLVGEEHLEVMERTGHRRIGPVDDAQPSTRENQTGSADLGTAPTRLGVRLTLMELTPVERFETDRLVVRRVRRDDAAALFHAFGDSDEATRFLTWSPKSSVDEYQLFLDEVALPAWEDHTGFHWVIEEDDSPFGMVSLDPGAHGLELGYVLSPGQWGRGFMVEAATPVVAWALAEPDVYRVWATCDCENTASVRVLEKLSFEFEGTLRRWAVHPNIGPEPRDSFCFSRTT